MRGRTATLALTWNGVAVTTQLSSHLISATYTDPACGESDTLEISLLNRGMEWANAWRPAKGDWLEGELQLENWEGEGAALTLSIGSMTLDGYSISGPPSTAQIQALSTPADGGFSETKRDKIWEQVTVEEVAKEIAGRAGLPLVWDVEAQPLVIPTVEQSRQTDAEFLQSLCTDYGYAMKVYSNQLVLFDREEYKKKPLLTPLPGRSYSPTSGKPPWPGRTPGAPSPTPTPIRRRM